MNHERMPIPCRRSFSIRAPAPQLQLIFTNPKSISLANRNETKRTLIKNLLSHSESVVIHCPFLTCSSPVAPPIEVLVVGPCRGFSQVNESLDALPVWMWLWSFREVEVEGSESGEHTDEAPEQLPASHLKLTLPAEYSASGFSLCREYKTCTNIIFKKKKEKKK